MLSVRAMIVRSFIIYAFSLFVSIWAYNENGYHRYRRSEMCTILNATTVGYNLSPKDFRALERSGLYDPYGPDDQTLFQSIIDDVNQQLIGTFPRVFSTMDNTPFTLASAHPYSGFSQVDPYPGFRFNTEVVYSATSITLMNRNRLVICDSCVDNDYILSKECTPKIVVVDLETNKIIHYSMIPRRLFIGRRSFLSNVVSYETEEETRLLIADSQQHCLFVFDFATNEFWRVDHKTFRADKSREFVVYNNIRKYVNNGVFSLVITPPIGKYDLRYVLYSSFNGETTSKVPLKILENRALWDEKYSLKPTTVEYLRNGRRFDVARRFMKKKVKYFDADKYFKVLGTSGLHQTGTCALIGYHYLCGVLGGVTVWNIKEKFIGDKFIVRTDGRAEWVTQVRSRMNSRGLDELLVNVSPIDAILTGNFDNEEINFTVKCCEYKILLKGDRSKCTCDYC